VRCYCMRGILIKRAQRFRYLRSQRRFTCAATGADCTAVRYHCTRRADVDLCPAAYAEGRFPAGTSARDFVRLDGAAAHTQVPTYRWSGQSLQLITLWGALPRRHLRPCFLRSNAEASQTQVSVHGLYLTAWHLVLVSKCSSGGSLPRRPASACDFVHIRQLDGKAGGCSDQELLLLEAVERWLLTVISENYRHMAAGRRAGGVERPGDAAADCTITM